MYEKNYVFDYFYISRIMIYYYYRFIIILDLELSENAHNNIYIIIILYQCVDDQCRYILLYFVNS